MGAFFAILFVLYAVPSVRGAEGVYLNVYASNVECTQKAAKLKLDHPENSYYCVKYDRH